MMDADDRFTAHRAYTAAQVREAERPLLEAGVPLMARAAAALAEHIRAVADTGAVLALVGSGDNGGDALHACALLAESGRTVTAVLLGSRAHEGGLEAARRAGVTVLAVREATATRVARLAEAVTVGDVVGRAQASRVVVDGIVGIGARGPLREPAHSLVAALKSQLNRSASTGAEAPHRSAEAPHSIVVAVDVPSGLDPDTGRLADAAVLPADVTVTFGAYKAGTVTHAADRIVGRLELVDIGLIPQLEGVVPALLW